MKKLNLSVDLRIVCGLLLVVIAAMLLMWKPWSGLSSAKTITVSGQGVVEAAPDEFVFYPYYSSTADTIENAIAKASEQGNDVIKQLKELGVSEDQISTSLDSYGTNEKQATDLYYPDPTSDKPTATYRITCKITDKALVQKITDYLASTGAQGGVTAQSQFGDESRDRLELEAREKAVESARKKAEAEARTLGVKLGKVTSVSDSSGYGIYPTGVAEDSKSGSSSGPISLSGKQEVTIAVTVSFEIK